MRQLLFSITKKDFEITYFSGTGAGGQYRNKHQNCVRLFHPESGVRVTGQSHRERLSNLSEAFHNFVNHPKFKVWHKRRALEVMEGRRIEDKVDEMMSRDGDFVVESRDENGNWINELDDTSLTD